MISSLGKAVRSSFRLQGQSPDRNPHRKKRPQTGVRRHVHQTDNPHHDLSNETGLNIRARTRTRTREQLHRGSAHPLRKPTTALNYILPYGSTGFPRKAQSPGSEEEGLDNISSTLGFEQPRDVFLQKRYTLTVNEENKLIKNKIAMYEAMSRKR
jgi:hypothetical protein